MTKKNPESSKGKRRSKPPPKKEPKDKQLISLAIQSFVAYILESAAFAIASWAASFFKLAGFVDLAVLILFLRDIEDLPEKAPRLWTSIKRIVQGGVVFGLSYLLGDTLGMLGSGLLVLFLGLYLFESFADWLETLVKRFDKWLSKMGLQ